MSEPANRVTELLRSIGDGDEAARERLFELLYDELRGMARRRLAGGSAHATLQATALVHEAYLRLADRAGDGWENRGHFFFAASRAMRDVLVDAARRKSAMRRGGDREPMSLDRLDVGLETPADQILALDEALRTIEAEDPRRADVVRLRFFSGLSEDETAGALGVSKRTVSREWALARARLALLMSPPDGA